MSENAAILEFKQRVSNSNITKIECMKSCDKQSMLSMKTTFVGDNNAIKRHKDVTRFTQFRLRLPVCSISLILSQRSSKSSQMENYNREEIWLFV